MEFLKIAKRRSFIGEVFYNALNIALAIAVFLVIYFSGSFIPALLLILLSKWRVLAVRPRFWVANIQANLVDVITSVGVVTLMYLAEGSLVTQTVLTLSYIAWLLFLKPRSKIGPMVLQAGVATVIGVTALYAASYNWPSVLVVALMWVIGYSVARHVLSAYDEVELSLLSIVWGLIVAEIGWISYHWVIAYHIFGTNLMLPQVTIITIAFSFVAHRFYALHVGGKKIKRNDIILPIILSVGTIVALLLFFNDAPFGGV